MKKEREDSLRLLKKMILKGDPKGFPYLLF